MKVSLPTRRVAATILAPALAAGTLLAAPAAQADQAPANSYAFSAARWLSDQLTDGVVHNNQYNFDDVGLTIDVFFALNDTGTRAATQQQIISAVSDQATDYTAPGVSVYAGATGKLAAAVQAHGGDPTDVDGKDLIAQLEGRVQESGRATDAFDPNDEWGGDYSNSIGQSWVVRALAGASSDLTDETVDYLLKQQCTDGSFRSAMDDAQCGGETGTIDATALAVRALSEASAAGQSGLDDDIAEAGTWLLRQQAQDGSFQTDDAPNTNSTGLAASTLQALGHTGAAGSAASWIVKHQVTDAVAEDTKLAHELGAIAFDLDALAQGKQNSITDATRDQWIRATAQAAVGVNAQLAAKRLSVTAPTAFIAAKKSVRVDVKSLAPFEKVRVTSTGGGSATGSANGSGTVTLTIKTGSATRAETVTVTGARSSRVGSAKVNVLAAKKLAISLKSTVKKKAKQKATVSGLAAAETVTVYVGGKKVKTAKANSAGKYAYSFKAGSKAGKTTVKFVGAFSNRNASKRFTVK